MARSERFELPTLGFEVRCSIQLSYERVPGARLPDLAGQGQQPAAGPKGAGPTDRLQGYPRRSGGLINYGIDLPDVYRQAGVYWSNSRAPKPADLPIMQPTGFLLVINLKTAELLGLSLSPGLLPIADEVIERSAAMHALLATRLPAIRPDECCVLTFRRIL